MIEGIVLPTLYRRVVVTVALVVVATACAGRMPLGSPPPSERPAQTSPPTRTAPPTAPADASDQPDGALELSVEPPVVQPGGDAVLVLRHAQGEPFEYGAEYTLHRRSDQGWEPYDECDGICAWPMWLGVVDAGGEGRQDITAPRRPGRYRISKSTDGAGTGRVQLEVREG